MNSISGAAFQAPGFLSLAVERQQTATFAAIKSQAKAEQAVADMVAQAVQQAPQPSGTPSPASGTPSLASGTPSPTPQRGSQVNILV